MSEHAFDLGKIVTVFQMHFSKGLTIEGQAAIVDLVADVDDQYIVRFRGDDDDQTYERFVDRFGQENPEQYVREFNQRIGSWACID